MSIVNSWNEWDPLEEVIVGTARGAADIGFEPALSPYFPPGAEGREFRGRPVPAAVVEDAERQLGHFADILERRGIVVRPPEPVDHHVPASTPDWDVAGRPSPPPPRGAFLRSCT